MTDEELTRGASPRVALLGVSWDGSSSFRRGAANAPPVIREALWSEAGNSWTESGRDLRAGGIEDDGDLVFGDGEQPEKAREMIETALDLIGASGRRPLVLGGDHSITYPALRGFHRHHERLAILHIDAHPDLYDDFEGDRYSHACPFARVMEEGLVNRLVQVGIRTMTGHQREQARRFGVEVIEMREWVDGRRLRFDAPLYLSLDLDGLEPGLAPGVSHPEPGGLTVRQVLSIIQGLDGPLVGADLVEFNPDADPSGLTAAVCGKLVRELADKMLEEI
jgi:arginase